MSQLPSGALPPRGDDFAVRFSTVHVGLVVCASADAVFGVAITVKGRGNVTDSPPMRPECKCKVEPCAVGWELHGGCDVLVSSAGGSSCRGKCLRQEGAHGGRVLIYFAAACYLKLSKSSLQSRRRPPSTARSSSSVGAKSCFSRTFHI